MVWCYIKQKYVADLRCITCGELNCKHKIPINRELFYQLKNDSRFVPVIELTRELKFVVKGKLLVDNNSDITWVDRKKVKRGEVKGKVFRPIANYSVKYSFRPKIYQLEPLVMINNSRLVLSNREGLLVLLHDQTPHVIITWYELPNSIDYNINYVVALGEYKIPSIKGR